MNKKNIFSTIFTILAVYVMADLVLFKGFLYNFLEAFFKSMAAQGKGGFITGLIGLSVALFGLISIAAAFIKRLYAKDMDEKKRKTLKITRIILGVLIVAAGIFVAQYGFSM